MVLDNLVGKELREKGISAASKQAATGQKKIASQKVTPLIPEETLITGLGRQMNRRLEGND